MELFLESATSVDRVAATRAGTGCRAAYLLVPLSSKFKVGLVASVMLTVAAAGSAPWWWRYVSGHHSDRSSRPFEIGAGHHVRGGHTSGTPNSAPVTFGAVQSLIHRAVTSRA